MKKNHQPRTVAALQCLLETDEWRSVNTIFERVRRISGQTISGVAYQLKEMERRGFVESRQEGFRNITEYRCTEAGVDFVFDLVTPMLTRSWPAWMRENDPEPDPEPERVNRKVTKVKRPPQKTAVAVMSDDKREIVTLKSVAEAAKLAGLHPTTVYDYLNKGLLKTQRRVDGVVRINPKEVIDAHQRQKERARRRAQERMRKQWADKRL